MLVQDVPGWPGTEMQKVPKINHSENNYKLGSGRDQSRQKAEHPSWTNRH